MTTWEDPDELVVCPYDPVHRVQRKRYQYHLMKCRKNFNKRDYEECPFNARHVIPRPEFEYHIQICEDRGRFEAEQLRAQTQRDPNLKGNTSVPAFDPTWCPETTESWDDDNVVYIPPTTGETLDRPRDRRTPPSLPSLPSQPPQSRPRPQVPPVEDVREPLQPRPPRLEGQATSQIFNQAMQSKPVGMTVGRGRGRGRGRGAPPGFQPNVYDEIVVGNNMKGVAMVPASAVVEAPEILEDRKMELTRRQKKLQKMLRQIERLESKTTPLLEEERVKVSKKQQIFDQLQFLSLEEN